MALCKELTEYRSKIMKLLCSDQEIVDLITDTPNSAIPDRSLMYKNIFPYAYTPDVTKDTNNYICFRIYIPEVQNKTLFNGSMDLGVGRMKLYGMDDISPASTFHGIALEYTVSEFNRPTINGDLRSGAK